MHAAARLLRLEFLVLPESQPLAQSISTIAESYCRQFSQKVYGEENEDSDLLMDLFGITPALKRENRQYWGRELGMCWQRIVVDACRKSCPDYGEAVRVAADVPCDLTIGRFAIDTKYRIGSGDSGTLKKFKAYGPLLKSMGYEPVALILREDNRASAISACQAGGWSVLTGKATLDFLKTQTGMDFERELRRAAGRFAVSR